MKLKAFGILLIILAIALFSSAYVVDETQVVVVTQFGKPVGEPKTEPGIYFKIPIIQKTNYFPKNLLEWDGDPGQIPTLDKTYIWVDTFARWKIVDPLKFFQTVNNVLGAQARLDDILDAAVRNLITSHPLIETVRNSNRPLGGEEYYSTQARTERDVMVTNVKIGRARIMEEIKKQAQPKVEEFGIKLVDVKLKRVNYVEQVRKSVYARMIAERKQMAEKFRSEGQGEARKIEGDREKELKRITSEAYMKAQMIKGKADAEAARIFAEAFGQDPEFYSFLKSLEVYRNTMDKDTTLVLSTDSDFLKYMKGYTLGTNQE